MLTRAVLLATLAGTALAVTDVLRRQDLQPRTVVTYLLLFTLLPVRPRNRQDYCHALGVSAREESGSEGRELPRDTSPGLG